MQRGVGLPGSDATSDAPHSLSRAVLVLQLGALDLGMFPRGIKGMGMSLFQGLVLAAVLSEQRLEKREKPVNCCRL